MFRTHKGTDIVTPFPGRTEGHSVPDEQRNTVSQTNEGTVFGQTEDTMFQASGGTPYSRRTEEHHVPDGRSDHLTKMDRGTRFPEQTEGHQIPVRQRETSPRLTEGHHILDKHHNLNKNRDTIFQTNREIWLNRGTSYSTQT